MTTLTFATRARHLLTLLAVSALLLVVRPAPAADEYPAPGFFLDGLNEQSSWNEITTKPGVKADFPFVGFETTFVPLSSVCVDGSALAIADPRIDTGVRVSADELRAQVKAATDAGRLAAEPGGQVAAAGASGQARQDALRYPVTVYKVTERGLLRQWVYLFEKPWPIPSCPAK
jgi:hypothetical protein